LQDKNEKIVGVNKMSNTFISRKVAKILMFFLAFLAALRENFIILSVQHVLVPTIKMKKS